MDERRRTDRKVTYRARLLSLKIFSYLVSINRFFFVKKRANEKKLKLMSQIPIIILYQLDSRIIKLSTIPITEEAFIS